MGTKTPLWVWLLACKSRAIIFSPVHTPIWPCIYCFPQRTGSFVKALFSLEFTTLSQVSKVQNMSNIHDLIMHFYSSQVALGWDSNRWGSLSHVTWVRSEVTGGVAPRGGVMTAGRGFATAELMSKAGPRMGKTLRLVHKCSLFMKLAVSSIWL